MNHNVKKFIFFAIVIGVVFFSVAVRPGLFINGNGANADAVKSASSTAPALLVLPSLSANIGDVTSSLVLPAKDDNQGQTSTSASPAPNVGVSEVLIANVQTGENLYMLNATERWPMASISKLMTAVVATDDLDPDQHITITEEMIAVDPSQKILHVGDTYTVSDLLKVMLLPSNNVAATAFADFYGYQNFMAAMNAKAQAWGMTNTYYDDPSGLSAANESTPEDLLKLAQNIYSQYPQIFAITREPQITVQNLSTNQPVAITSINQFAGTPDFIGGKTGYTDQADGNLLSIFNDNGTPIFIVVLGIDDGVRFDATQELYNWFKHNS